MGILLSWLLLLLPWAVIFFLDQEKVRRFLSVTFFCCVVTVIWFQVADYLDWWETPAVLPYLGNIPSFAFGVSPVATLLIFYFTYPNAWVFFLVNIVMDAVQAYVIGPYVYEKFGLYRMLNLSDTGLYLLLLSIVPIIYLYQLWYEKGRYDYTELFAWPRWREWKRKAR